MGKEGTSQSQPEPDTLVMGGADTGAGGTSSGAAEVAPTLLHNLTFLCLPSASRGASNDLSPIFHPTPP